MTSADSTPEAQALLSAALRSLDVLVIESPMTNTARVVGTPPPWTEHFHAGDPVRAIEDSPFLADFVHDAAREFWNSQLSKRALHSGVWTEAGVPGTAEEHYEAVAIRNFDGAPLLLIKRLGHAYDELQWLTQRANEHALEHRQLSREAQKKDVLLKCIVHDLNSPLNAVLICLETLTLSQDEATRESAALALEAARRQRSLIGSVTELFSSDISRLNTNQEATVTIRDLQAAAEHVVKLHLVESLRRSISVVLEDGIPADESILNRKVYGETTSYSRAIENLVVNAMRYAPKNSPVRVGLKLTDEFLLTSVEDAGSGVEPALVDTLFDPFVQGESARGSMGLGLYFCKMTAEQWGGCITYTPAESGGARFVFALPLA